ncbi:S46 family peptidase [Luteimonas sp. SJ-92]|uniref:Dipeptidyl-peptidase n=1 Tax=Luteimonas salinisoli TaxID=2752307 RepID=A0A853JFX0_9GAMM|nr:S46 family peptidase [Luteimonas salinisoli]NZA27622.1 S46 family peptidase [Luteimonas salinisoli]
MRTQMRRIAIAIALLLAADLAGAGEGMWVPQQLPEIEAPLRKAGLRLRPEQFADLTGDPMGAVVSLGGCTASFVSPQGLVVTNHHCAYGAIQLNSTPDNNLMRDGFVAATADDEPSAGPNARIFVLDSIRDVTGQVQAAIAAAPDAIGRARALEQIEKKLIAGCEFREGYRCRLYSFAGGNVYRLFRNLEIRDVRLAYAPPGGIGNYGGEVDNWMWPRHTGDFAFYRAYVGPDGQPADHAAENVPYQPKRWLQFADRPLREGDFVMAAGYPGTTRRYALADEFEQTAEWSYPTLSRHYKAMLELVEVQGRENPDIAVKYASSVGGWKNTSKNYDGQLEGFARIDAAAAKRAEEAAVLEWLRGRGEAGAEALEAHAELVRLLAEGQATRERDLVLGQLHRLGALGTAMTLYRNAIERTNPDADREPGHQERDQPRIRGELQQMERRYHPDMDRQLQRYWLQQYAALPAEQRVEAIDGWLGGDDEAAIERALDRLAGTGLANVEERLRWLEADRDAFENSRDPAILYAVAVMPEVLRQELERKARAGDELRARPVYLQAVAEHRASQGNHVYPDANGSLRITFGNVTGYTKLDGEEQAPFTRLEEVAQKATGEEPFDAPQALLDAVAEGRDGGLADRRLRSVPVNFLSDLDVTGGNSGSPVLDARGRLTGLLFDMNWESVSSNWVFDPAMTRTISVDQRYLRWIMQEAYPAPQLLEELGLAP